jgi:hypothetical protein
MHMSAPYTIHHGRSFVRPHDVSVGTEKTWLRLDVESINPLKLLGNDNAEARPHNSNCTTSQNITVLRSGVTAAIGRHKIGTWQFLEIYSYNAPKVILIRT